MNERHALFVCSLVACQRGAEAPDGPVDLGSASAASGSSGDSSATDVPTTGTASSTSAATGSSSTGETSTSASSPAGETTAAAPVCGDGHVDPGEDCDAGAAENSDHGACTLRCQTAVCGDALVWGGEEDCDAGSNNNDALYGGCTTQCRWGPRCQDGEVQGPEECDLGDANGTGEFPPFGVPCDSGCRFDARLVFISSVAYKGGELGGVEGAHLKCQALAQQGKFDNAAKFRAWLSDAQHSPSADFDHGPEQAGLAYVRPDGVRIADDWDDLVLNGPGDGIVVAETGELLPGKGVWTGTTPSGALFDPDATCKAWSSAKLVDQSRRGLSSVDKQQVQAWMQWVADRQWTSYTNFACQGAYRIYCFEQ